MAQPQPTGWYPSGSPGGHRARFGWFRFGLASISHHPLLFLLTLVIICIAGIVSLWLRPEAWRATAQLHVPNSIKPVVDVEPTAATQRDVLLDLNATDVAELLGSRTLLHSVREAAASTASHPGIDDRPIHLTLSDEAAPVTAATRARDAVRAAWAITRQRLADAAEYMGLHSGQASAGDNQATGHAGPQVYSIEVQPTNRDQNVISFEVWASDPDTARQAAELLVVAVRTQLTTVYQERAMRRWRQLVPTLETVAVNRAAAQTDLEQYRQTLQNQSPAAYAVHLEEVVADTRARLTALETEKAEIQAQRHRVSGQLNEISLDSQEEVVSAENPRLRELMGDISDLEAEYASKLARYTEKHSEMVQLRNQIDSKKEELGTIQQTVIRETVRGPNPVFTELIRTQMELDQRLNQLAGRELGLTRAEKELTEELRETTAVADKLAALESNANSLNTQWQTLKSETAWLRAILDDDFLLADLGLSRQAVVDDPDRPDRPVASIHLGLSGVIAVLCSIMSCVIRAAWRNRVLGRWQIEELSEQVPLTIVAELPRAPYRRLLRKQASKALA